jgi:hypothetical protein
MKRKRNDSVGASALQIALGIALILPAAILFASAFRTAAIGGSETGTAQTAAVQLEPDGCVPSYTFAVAGRNFVPAVDDIGNHCDNCSTVITLPFPITLYDQTYTAATAGSNGHLTFGAAYDGFRYHLFAVREHDGHVRHGSLLGPPMHHRMRYHCMYGMWHLYDHDWHCSEPRFLCGIPHAVL